MLDDDEEGAFEPTEVNAIVNKVRARTLLRCTRSLRLFPLRCAGSFAARCRARVAPAPRLAASRRSAPLR